MSSLRQDRLGALLADSDLAGLIACLSPEGHEARIVGGAVRNALIGSPPTDIDLAVTLLPEAVMARARDAGFQAIPTGITHGTITILLAGRPIEVTTLREDIATDGRHAEVRFGLDFRQDAARRDFTMNAMSLSQDGRLHDYFGGQDDLAARQLRFIGDPDQRLREDYLRALRFLRFSAVYGDGQLDEAGWAAVLRQRAGIRHLSRERIRQEFFKLIDAPHALLVLQRAQEAELFAEILGLSVSIPSLSARLAMADRLNEGPVGALPRLAALAVDGDASIAHLREALRLTNAEEHWLRSLEAARRVLASDDPLALFRIGDLYPEAAPEALKRDVILRHDEARLRHLPSVLNPPVFSLSGKDVLALGVAAGPEIGALLNAAKEAWAEAGCDPAIETQKRLLKEVLSRRKS